MSEKELIQKQVVIEQAPWARFLKCALCFPSIFLKNFLYENLNACLESAAYKKLSGNFGTPDFSAKV